LQSIKLLKEEQKDTAGESSCGSVLEPWFDAPKFVRTAIACLAGYLRKHFGWKPNPAIITVSGGSYLLLLYPRKPCSKLPSFYIDEVGEGEETLAELCDAIAKGNDLNTRIWVEGN
jgi:hypothetical protein